MTTYRVSFTRDAFILEENEGGDTYVVLGDTFYKSTESTWFDSKDVPGNLRGTLHSEAITCPVSYERSARGRSLQAIIEDTWHYISYPVQRTWVDVIPPAFFQLESREEASRAIRAYLTRLSY